MNIIRRIYIGILIGSAIMLFTGIYLMTSLEADGLTSRPTWEAEGYVPDELSAYYLVLTINMTYHKI